MPKYEIWAGLDIFDGAQFICIEEHPNQESANQSAYEYACEEYEEHAGTHNLPTYDMIVRDEGLDLDDDSDALYADLLYENELSSWITYFTKRV